MLLDHHREARELQHVGVGERELHPIGLGHIDRAHRLAGHRLVGEHHLDELRTQVAADHRRLAQGEGGLVNVELIRIHRSLDDRLAQAVGSGDEYHVLEARFGVDREHHPRGAGVGADHALNAGGQRHLGMGEALVHPVGDRAIVVERREDLLHRVEDVLVAMDVEEGLLLPGERRVRQILGRRRRAHREAALPLGSQRVIGGVDLRFELRRKRRIDDPSTNLGAGLHERIHVVDIERLERGTDALGEPLVSEKLAIGVGGGGKSTGHANAGGQLADHLAERSVLAAHLLHVGHAQFGEWDDVTSHE